MSEHPAVIDFNWLHWEWSHNLPLAYFSQRRIAGLNIFLFWVDGLNVESSEERVL